jgi:hypothetical protein
MRKALTADSILPYALLGMTAVTGLVAAVSFLFLGQGTVASEEQRSQVSCRSEELIGTKSAAHPVIWRN